MEEKWMELENNIQKFFYGEKGIETTAYADENLDTYNWEMENIIEILKQIKEIESDLTEKQKEKLKSYKEYFLQIDNGKNEIKQMHNKILYIYKNIEEY